MSRNQGVNINFLKNEDTKQIKVLGVYPHPQQLKTHHEQISLIKFNIKNASINFKKNVKNKKELLILDYFALIEITIANNKGQIDKSLCAFTFNVGLGDKFSNSAWQVTKVFGRTGFGPGNFSLPYGTEFRDNIFFVSDCSNGNISMFSKNGEFINYFGNYGTKSGQFDTPADIKVSADRLYVVEERNHRVQVFDRNGKSLLVFGAYKEVKNKNLFLDKFAFPLGIAISNETIVVVDYKNNRILAYDLNFNFKWVLNNQNSNTKNIKIRGPYYAEFIPATQNFVITNRSGNNMILVSKNGKVIKSFGENILKSPHEVAVGPSGDVYVANTKGNSIVRFHFHNNYETNDEIKFPKSYGLPKTVASIEKEFIRVGFVGNGRAFFIDLQHKKDQATNYLKSNKNKFLKINYKETDIGIKYVKYCASCHEEGRYGAPQRGNIESWEKYSKDINKLTDLAIQGKGAMIANGGCDECTRKDIYEIIKNYLIPMNW